MLASTFLFSLPLFAASTWAAPAPGLINPLTKVKRAEPNEVVELFKRQSAYPPALQVPPESSTPKAWLDRLASLQLPSDIPVSTGIPLPAYGNRSKTDPAICSFTYSCQNSEDLYAPPPGSISFTFDDGVSGGSEALRDFMKANNATGKATHFMIGSYIVQDQEKFKSVAREGAHIGVHTWSHTYMTTLTNTQVVAELGWTMQIISDLNGGRVPRYWRPPFGDVDNRVRAIAKGVFGLETVIWNHDTGDWNLDQPGSTYTYPSIIAAYTQWLGDKSQGLNVLEHEVRTSQIEVFKTVYGLAGQMGWRIGNVADMWGKPWYQNAASAFSPVTSMSVGAGSVSMASASASSSGNSTSSSMSANATSVVNSTSASTSTSSSISSTSSSVSITSSQTAAATNQNAVSPSASATKASGAGARWAAAGWALVIPALGMVTLL